MMVEEEIVALLDVVVGNESEEVEGGAGRESETVRRQGP